MGRLLPGLLVATLLAVGPVRAAEQPPVNDPAGEGEVMVDVEFHALPVDRLEVRPGHDA